MESTDVASPVPGAGHGSVGGLDELLAKIDRLADAVATSADAGAAAGSAIRAPSTRIGTLQDRSKALTDQEGVRRRRASLVPDNPYPATRGHRSMTAVASNDELAKLHADFVAHSEVDPRLHDVLHEAQSDFSAGFVRYAQHGTGTRSGAALKFRISNAESFLVKVLHVHEFLSAEAWRAAFIEMIGSFFFNFVQISIVFASIMTVSPPTPPDADNTTIHEPLAIGSETIEVHVVADYASPPPAPMMLIAPLTAIMAVGLIFAMSPVSGGHFNPMVSLSTAINGLMTPARAFMYICAQMLGCLAGTGCIYFILGGMDNPLVAATGLAGCSYGVPDERALVGEMLAAVFVLWLFYSIAFDPQQFEVFGPIVAPLLLVVLLGFVIFTFGTAFGGVALHAGRCLWPALITGVHVDKQYIIIVGDILAALIHAIIFRLVPPQHVQDFEEAQEQVKAERAAKAGGNAAEADTVGLAMGTLGDAKAE